jgi:hypothetical protein
MIVRSWNLRPRPGRYDDAIGLITEGVKLADRHGARDIRLTQAATSGPNTGLLVLTCEFDNMSAYGTYLDDTLDDAETVSYSHRIREAEAPFIYESTAVLVEIDLERSEPKRGRGRVLDARLGRVRPGQWDETLAFAQGAFDLCDAHGAVGCRLLELNYAGPQSGLLCAVIEYNSMKEYGEAADWWLSDPDARGVTDRLRGDSPFEPVSTGLFTEVSIL